jgi:exopolyphosphatase/guanosine-5'-triphosphate,3'-diphosphate pyrophosphatase
VAGVAVLHELIQELKLPRLYYSAAGVRDGIIADLIQRKAGLERSRLDEDQRQIVRALSRRYGISPPHVRKVAELASLLFHDLRTVHRVAPERGRVLEAAAYLYNIGHFVNEARHHRHSMYLVANSDMPGFDERERLMVANLCRYHRKSMPMASHEVFQGLDPDDRRTVTMLIPLLRIAVALDQSQEQRVDRVEAQVQEDAVQLWLHSERDVDIEQWQAQQVQDVFREVYGLSLGVKAKR